MNTNDNTGNLKIVKKKKLLFLAFIMYYINIQNIEYVYFVNNYTFNREFVPENMFQKQVMMVLGT